MHRVVDAVDQGRERRGRLHGKPDAVSEHGVVPGPHRAQRRTAGAGRRADVGQRQVGDLVGAERGGRADHRGRQQGRAQRDGVVRCRGGVDADQPVDPADAGGRARVGVLDLLHRLEVAAVGYRQTDGVDGAERAGVPHRHQVGERRVQPEARVGAEERALGHEDRGAVVGEVVVVDAARHHHGEAVGSPAQAQDDDHVAAGHAAVRGLQEGVADHLGAHEGARAGSRGAEQPAAGHVRPGEVRTTAELDWAERVFGVGARVWQGVVGLRPGDGRRRLPPRCRPGATGVSWMDIGGSFLVRGG